MSICMDGIDLGVLSGEIQLWPPTRNGGRNEIPCGRFTCDLCTIGICIGVDSEDLDNEDCGNIKCPFCKSRCTAAYMCRDGEPRPHRGRGVISMSCGTELYICDNRMTSYKTGNRCHTIHDYDVI